MIQGATYDQVMKFIDPTTSFVKTTGKVGHGSSYFTSYPYQTGGLNYSSVYTGTVTYNDVAKNIYDLEGNVSAWTTEAYNTYGRVLRGGGYSYSYSPSNRYYWVPYSGTLSNGSICQLYIHDEHTYIDGVCGCGAKLTTIPTTTPYVGYYADVDGDPTTVEGVIFADQGYGPVGDGEWGNDGWGIYTIPKVTSGLKSYYISKESYTGKFGTKAVISPVSGTTGTDRFYVMALDDFDSNEHYWYYSAYDTLMSDYETYTSWDFGTGKTNTTKMITKWNASGYGSQNSNDIWGLIQNKAKGGWFVPSVAEWSAFVEEIGITSSEYASTNDLRDWYWTSTQLDFNMVVCVEFGNYWLPWDAEVDSTCYLRLCTTF